jgi:hypothetical protein
MLGKAHYSWHEAQYNRNAYRCSTLNCLIDPPEIPSFKSRAIFVKVLNFYQKAFYFLERHR